MQENRVKKNHDLFVFLGIGIYILGFIFLGLVGRDYTGVMSFLAPASILSGAVITVLGLIF